MLLCILLLTAHLLRAVCPPMPRVSRGSGARQASSSWEAMLSRVMPLSRHTLTNCTTSWLLITSHTPSHASTKNLSSERSSTWRSSDSASSLQLQVGNLPRKKKADHAHGMCPDFITIS